MPTFAPLLFNLLQNCDLVDLHLDHNGTELRLTFSWEGFAGGEGHNLVLLLRNVVFFWFSHAIDPERNYLVSGATLADLGSDGIITLPAVPHKGRDVRHIYVDCPTRPLRHLSLQGSLMFEVVCVEIEILSEEYAGMLLP